MKRILKILLLFAFCFLLIDKTKSQITIVVANASTFPDSITDKMFVAGNFNNWNPGNADYRLRWKENKLTVTIPIDANTSSVEFKFTCGTWEKEEVNADGSKKENRTYFYKPGIVLNETIAGFAHVIPPKIIPPNTNVIKFNVYSPQLKRDKQIRVLLPCDYDNTNNSYPVLYMLDGQNLFDASESNNGEWGVDETMDSLCNLGLKNAIIVGIDNAGDLRLEEYSPFPIKDYINNGKGDDFAAFVVNTLKPEIDKKYRTLPGREFTGIAGSSMGSVEGLYMILKYDSVFSMAGLFSPAFWTNKENYLYAEKSVVDYPIKLYFLAGAMEGGDFGMVTDVQKMMQLFLNQKNPNIKMRSTIQSNGTHSESFWRNEFFDMFNWLYLEE